MHTGQLKTAPSSSKLSLGEFGPKLMILSALVGLVSLVLAFGISFAGEESFKLFSFAYFVAYCFFLTISLGGLFFVIILHLTRGGWGVSVRRLAELIAVGIIPLLILFLPILLPVLFGNDVIYSWVKEDLGGKTTYFLNSGFFGLRSVAYFAVWGLIALYFLRTSLAQDESGDPKLTLRMQSRSAPFTFLFAIALIFASFDFEMSLEPVWFSTMFPVYIFAGAMVGFLSTTILVTVFLNKVGRLNEDITTDNFHDLSKLLFGFVVFWGYIAFSQYLLIWYANLPEETFWYQIRLSNSWTVLSAILLVGHILVPLLAIMPRTLRRSRKYMTFAAIFMLLMHYCDHFWLIMPAFNSELPTDPFTLICSLLCFIGVGGLYTAAICWIAADRPLIPMKDPRLVESLNYTNP